MADIHWILVEYVRLELLVLGESRVRAAIVIEAAQSSSAEASGSSVDEFEVASDGKHSESSTIVIVSSHKRVNQLSGAEVELGGV